MESLHVRDAVAGDAPLLKRLIDEMAEHAHLDVPRTQEQLTIDGFGPHPAFRALLAEWEGEAAGYAMFYDCYSSFRGRGIFLEDVYVRERFRGKAIATAFLSHVARIALERGAFGIEFNVFDWNEPAMRFFKKAGAEELQGRKTLCIARDTLRARFS